MPLPSNADYGRCPCTGRYLAQYRSAELSVGEKTVQLAEVPQGTCLVCGAVVFKAFVVAEMEAALRGEDGPPPSSGF